MYVVVLFGGGDAGGIIITPTGIKRIPPWDPEIRLKAADLSHVVNAGRLSPSVRRTSASLERKLVKAVTAGIADQVARVAPELEGTQGLVASFDPDGGFVCGSTGRKPIPMPPKKDFSFEELGLEGFGSG
jgi:hypothetical protein